MSQVTGTEDMLLLLGTGWADALYCSVFIEINSVKQLLLVLYPAIQITVKARTSSGFHQIL